VFFGFVTTLISFASFAAVFWLFEKNGILSGESPSLAELMVKHTWLNYVPNLSASMRVFAANLAAWVLAVAFSFVVNKHFVFRSRSWKRKVFLKELGGFVGSRMISLLAETAVLIVLVSFLAANELLAKAAAMVVVLVLNYIFSKLFVFKKRVS